MKKQVLKTDQTAIQRELNKIETSIEMFQPLLDAMIKNGYEPTLSEFRAIVRSRNERKSSYFDDFLRDKTVKKHPEIERLPITAFMKKTLILNQLDAKIKKLNTESITELPSIGWIKATRMALGMSQEQLGKKLQITRQSVQELEKREKEGTITLKTLKEVD